MSKTNRREFLIKNAPLIAAPLLLPLLSDQIVSSHVHGLMNRASSPPLMPDATQGEWRYCDKCNVLFFNGAANKGRCQAGGGHEAQGYGFLLPYGSLPEIPKAQINWRFCDKCYAMFWDGIPDKGHCPAGGGHHAQGFLFRLPHDINADGNNQGGWRYCQKCRGMFYDGYSNKGKCPAGGAHVAQGYLFVLPHSAPPDIHLRSDVSTKDWAPIGGWVDLVAKQNGDYVFSGHMHNSGAVNFRFTLGVVLMTPSGRGFGFLVENHRLDGTEVIVGRNRDFDWGGLRNDSALAQNWDQVARGSLHWKLVAADTITGGSVLSFLGNVAKEAYNDTFGADINTLVSLAKLVSKI